LVRNALAWSAQRERDATRTNQETRNHRVS
jgi:hypothetical protein